MNRHTIFSFTTAALFAGASVNAAHAQQIITQFNFNSVVPDAAVGTGTQSPSIGNGILTAINVGTPTFATGSPGDTSTTTDNSGINLSTFPAATVGNNTAGIQTAVSTVGFTGITLTLDFRQSATASRFFQLLVSSDGSSFAAPTGGIASILGPINSPNTGTSFTNTGLYSNNSGSGSQQFVQGVQYSFPAGSSFENDANFAFRWVAAFDPNGTGYVASNTTSTYSAAGTARFDQVTVSAVPEPSTYAMIGGGLGLLLLGQRVRRTARA